MTDRLLPRPNAERRLAVGALAAELGHELQGPLNLFRLNAERLARGETLDEEDLGLLGEELERMSAIGGRLRELARVSGQKVACTPQQLVDLALRGTSLELETEVTDSETILCDPTLLSQALRELFTNASEAKTTRAGVRFQVGDVRGFCVWDDGEGFTLSTERALAWGVTTQPFAAGLGLTVALRAARAHGFDLELRRVPPRTEAWILMPARELARQAAT